MEAIAYLVAALFAVNIGASGAAAAMGHVYGARALRIRIVALGLAAAAMLSGAVFAGSPVTETLSADLAPSADVTAVIALMVLVSATGPLLLANLLGLPLSTSAVTVGAIAGLGIAAGSIDGGVAGTIGLWWVVLPAASFSLSAVGTRVLQRSGLQKRLLRSKRMRSAMALVLVAGGMYVAFGVGANNVSNAIAPLLGAGLLESPTALVLGGIALAIGAVALGGRVLRTNALRFATLDMTTGSLVAFVSGSLILAASLAGFPAALAQVATSAILGVGFAQRGVRALRRQPTRDLATAWVVSPVASLVLAYILVSWAYGASLAGHWEAYAILAAGGLFVLGALFILNRPRLLHVVSASRARLLELKRAAATALGMLAL